MLAENMIGSERRLHGTALRAENMTPLFVLWLSLTRQGPMVLYLAFVVCKLTGERRENMKGDTKTTMCVSRLCVTLYMLFLACFYQVSDKSNRSIYFYDFFRCKADLIIDKKTSSIETATFPFILYMSVGKLIYFLGGREKRESNG